MFRVGVAFTLEYNVKKVLIKFKKLTRIMGVMANPHFSHSLGKVLRSVFRGCKKERSDIVLETRPTRLFYKIEEQSVEIFRKVCEKCGLSFLGITPSKN